MNTKINSYASNLMSNAVSTLKEAKAKKAESAFYSLLDTAVKGNASQNQSENLQKVSTAEKNTGKDTQSEVQDQSITTADTNTQKTNTQKPAEQTTTDADSGDQTNLEKAEDVIKKLCEELNITQEELLTQFDQLLSTIASILMEQFQVTEQELTQVLNQLDLTLVDLLNQPDLMDVSVMLAGAEDISAVLTDEGLYQQIQEVTKDIASLQEELAADTGLDADQLKALEESIETIAQAETPVLSEENRQSVNAELHNLTRQTGALEETAAEEPIVEIITDKADSENLTDRNADSHGQTLTGNESFQQFTGKVAEYMETAAAAGNEFAQRADMESIIRQVTDYVRLQANAETTSLEMQLHPESYGKLNLQVSVRDGVVTARMAVENEMVKSALEAQVVQLREDMNERGLKVDAVEVAIASHEFERNLEEGQEQHEPTQEHTAGTRRQINLQESEMSLEELAEMSESEALIRKIMIENGNSIDYSA
ncbi:MAG: hypothetical protein HFI75_10270 [Lachnospiraceae bacterium]|nr:hypothetical protein [Lachnospiraceae bacterium]